MCSCEESMNTICCKLACNRFGGMALRRPNRRGKAARGKSSKRKSARAVAMTCESRDAIDKFESFLLEAKRGSRFVGRDRPEENEKQKFSFACNSQRGSAIFTFFSLLLSRLSFAFLPCEIMRRSGFCSDCKPRFVSD